MSKEVLSLAELCEQLQYTPQEAFPPAMSAAWSVTHVYDMLKLLEAASKAPDQMAVMRIVNVSADIVATVCQWKPEYAEVLDMTTLTPLMWWSMLMKDLLEWLPKVPDWVVLTKERRVALVCRWCDELLYGDNHPAIKESKIPMSWLALTEGWTMEDYYTVARLHPTKLKRLHQMTKDDKWLLTTEYRVQLLKENPICIVGPIACHDFNVNQWITLMKSNGMFVSACPKDILESLTAYELDILVDLHPTAFKNVSWAIKHPRLRYHLLKHRVEHEYPDIDFSDVPVDWWFDLWVTGKRTFDEIESMLPKASISDLSWLVLACTTDEQLMQLWDSWLNTPAVYLNQLHDAALVKLLSVEQIYKSQDLKQFNLNKMSPVYLSKLMDAPHVSPQVVLWMLHSDTLESLDWSLMDSRYMTAACHQIPVLVPADGWTHILKRHPELAVHCKPAYVCKGDWLSVLEYNAEMIDACDMESLPVANIVSTLKRLPELKRHCPYHRLSVYDWVNWLSTYPTDINKCPREIVRKLSSYLVDNIRLQPDLYAMIDLGSLSHIELLETMERDPELSISAEFNKLSQANREKVAEAVLKHLSGKD